MGVVAQAFLDEGRHTRAVVPEPLLRHGSKQIATTVDVVPDMHTRKQTMNNHVSLYIYNRIEFCLN